MWKPALSSVYLFSGEEDRLKEEAVRALITRVVSMDFREFDLEKLEASSMTADGILAAAGQLPFGSDRRVVVVTGLEQWRDRNRQSEAERLSQGLLCLGDSACLILVVGAEEEEGKRKTAVTAKLDAAVKKIGMAVTFPALKGEALFSWITVRVRQEHKRIEPEAMECLVATIGNEMRTLEHEIIKLVCYVDERETITISDVSFVVTSSPEDVVFAAVEAITKRNPNRALTLLAELHRFDPKPQAVAGKLLALLARQYRMLWQAKFLGERRVQARDIRSLPPEIAAELPAESNIAQLAFKAADLISQARTYAWTDLSRALDLLLLCDLANKGGAGEEAQAFRADPVHNLQVLVVMLTTSAGARA